MFWRFVLTFILLSTLDLLGLMFFCSNMFGFFLAVIAMIVSGLFGAFLVRYQGLYYWIEFNRQLDRGESPVLSVQHGIFILFAAILLVVPGLITEFIGLMLLISPIRSLLISYIQLRFEAYRTQPARRSSPQQTTPSDVIDIE